MQSVFITVPVLVTELYLVITLSVSKRQYEGKIQKWPASLLLSLIKALIILVVRSVSSK